MAPRSRKPPWTDLPQELLSTIANSLTSNPLDVIAFRSVCKSWRSSFPRLPHPSLLSPTLPFSVPRPPFSYYGDNNKSITVTFIYALRRPLELDLSQGLLSSPSPTSWILFIDEFNAGKLNIRKPFSKWKYHLPITFPKTLNLLDFNARELGRFYSLSLCSGDINKLVLFPDSSAAVALFDGKLGFIRMDLEISEWEIIHDGKGFRFDDIVVFKGRVLGIDRRGRVYEIARHLSKLKPVVSSIPGGGGRRKRLVESLGLLYLVVRCKANPNKTREKSTINVQDHNEETNKTKFKVYELDEAKKKWFEVTSIGDRSFFFGIDFSFSASVQDLGTCEKDCILFKRESFQSYNREFDDDYRVFCQLERSDLDFAVYHLNDGFLSMSVESNPGYADILWPPPSWIWPFDRSKRLGILETAIDEILNKYPGMLKTAVKEETVEGAVVSCDDIRQQGFPDYVKEAIALKNLVISIKETETKLTHEFGVCTDMLNQIQSKVLEARAASRDSEERANWPNELPNFDFPPRFIHMLRKVDALVFQLEEEVSRVVRPGRARVVPNLRRFMT